MKEFVLQADPGRKLKIEYEKELNAEQLAVVFGGDGPTLVLAGAGSGKTRTITYRVAYLIEQGVSPENILLVTFTNKAAKEMLERVESLLGYYPKGLWGGTFHSIANRILHTYAHDLGFSPNFTILDSEDSRSMVKVCVKELQIDSTARRFPSPAKLLAMISYARNSSDSLRKVVEERFSNFFELIPTIERIGELYEHHKRQSDAMDFDDLLVRLRDVLFSNPVLRDRLSEQFQYVLVDEYQDTNVVQAQIVRELSRVHENVLVVGDDAQSIYSFRAAQIKNILDFPLIFPGAKTFRLVTNYRSTPEILNVANASIANNVDQFKKELKAIRPSSELPNIVPSSNASQEAQYIAQQILVLREEGTPLKEIAVLFRAAFHSQALEFELMRRDIPYEYRGGMKFFERAHVKDVISFLRVKQNPRDEMAWMRVMGLQPGIGLTTAQKLIAQIQYAETLDQVLMSDIQVGKRAGAGWMSLVKTLQKLAIESLPADLIRSVTAGEYRDYLEAEYPDFMDRLEDLEQFALFAEGYTELKTFLDEVSLTSDYGNLKEDGSGYQEEKIVLSTIHQAKGLEWDTVFVMHLVDDKFPNLRALDEEGGIEEERRLFYVATTRARKRLIYTYPITSGYDTLAVCQPSMFLEELPTALCEMVKLKGTVSRPPISRFTQEDEPIIVLDDLGEPVDRGSIAKMSFLRDVNDL